MSEYQRFVSYLYEYQDNEKSKNCGFSRVEVRNRQCKIEVHMKLPQLPFVPEFQVYAFVPSKDQLLGIHLGKASYHQGAVYGIFTIPEQQIGGQPYALKDLGGILIQTDGGQIFATAWKEMTILPNQFVLPENPEAVPQIRAASLDDYQLPPVQDTPDSPEAPNPSDSEDSAAPPEEYDSYTHSSPRDDADSRMHASPPDNADSGIHVSPPDNADSRMHTSHQNKSDTDTGDSVTASSPKEFKESQTSPDRWQKIQEVYPHIEPFFDEEICECVQLSLKDLPDLGKYSLYIGANQFLTHGCQTYQHLLLGRFSDGNPDEYVLGVPGVYDEKERFLAGMFGFPNFKPARSKTIRPGQFGYWYRFIY